MAGKKPKTPPPSAHEVALADVAKKKFDVYNELYRPLVKDRLNSTKATKARIEQAKGASHADQMMQNKNTDSDIVAAGLRGGLNLGDNRLMGARAAQQVSESSVAGHASALGTRAAKHQERQGKIDHIKLGHGLASDTMQSLSTLAGSANSMAIQQAQSDFSAGNSMITGLGQMAGLAYGAGAFDGFGGTARPQFASYQLNSGGRSMR
jgi:hypothetical protein